MKRVFVLLTVLLVGCVSFQPQADFEGLVHSVVAIESSVGIGSGIIIDKRGYILTNDHVIQGGVQKVYYLDEQGFVQNKPAIMSYGWQEGDLAVVKIEPEEYFEPARFGDSDKVKVGDTIYAIGHPYDIPWTCTRGIVSAIRYMKNGQKLFQHDAMIGPGNSGGLLANERGEIVGINFAAVAIGLNYFLPPISWGVHYAIASNIARTAAEAIIEIFEELECGREKLLPG